MKFKKGVNFMKFIITCIAMYAISYLFGSFAFPQIIGSARMIVSGSKRPYTFTLILWSAIFMCVTLLVYFYLSKYFIIYLIALVLPLIFTIRTKNIE